MPVVTIKIAGSLTRGQKQKVAEEITATLEKHAGKPASYTYIVFEEMRKKMFMKFIFYISLSDFIMNLTSLIGFPAVRRSRMGQHTCFILFMFLLFAHQY